MPSLPLSRLSAVVLDLASTTSSECFPSVLLRDAPVRPDAFFVLAGSGVTADLARGAVGGFPGGIRPVVRPRGGATWGRGGLGGLRAGGAPAVVAGGAFVGAFGAGGALRAAVSAPALPGARGGVRVLVRFGASVPSWTDSDFMPLRRARVLPFGSMVF